jgi:hypothetical protein
MICCNCRDCDCDCHEPDWDFIIRTALDPEALPMFRFAARKYIEDTLRPSLFSALAKGEPYEDLSSPTITWPES